jgi:hypothetical protein
MNRFLILFLLAILSAPVGAQLGPAGVPGVFGLAESLLPSKPASNAKNQIPLPEKCRDVRNPESCRLREATRSRVLEACKGKKGSAFQQCRKETEWNEQCRSTPEPALCLQHLKARETCGSKLGPEHRQCLREALSTGR